jgi:integrase
MLTELECKNNECPPGKKQVRFADSGGMYLQISAGGSKRWFMKYRVEGKEKQLALGSYPAVSLSSARRARDAAKLQKAQGIDPVMARKSEKLKQTFASGDTFKELALEWFDLQSSSWSKSHSDRTRRNLEKDLIPYIGAKSMPEIQSMEILACVKKVEERGSLEVAKRVLDTASQVFEHWLPLAPPQYRNVTQGLKKRLTPRVKGHFPAITNPNDFGGLLRAMRAYKGGPLVRVALQLAPILYQRPGNLRMMEWCELDLDQALWTIPSAKMKGTLKRKEQGAPHVVPLPRQAVALLQSLQPLTGHGKYVFPGERDHDRPLCDNSVRSALYALGYGKEQSWHGFRASARTMLVDELNADPLAIEANLAHAVQDSNGRSYNRTQYIKQRFEQVQIWADYLDKLAEDNVVSLTNKAASKRA